jgi:hypothetical protein
MVEMVAKCQVRTLINDAISKAINTSRPFASLRGVAFFDMRRDDFLLTLEKFGTTATAIKALPDFCTRFGEDAGTRALLQLVYEYFDQVGELKFDNMVFEKLWTAFTTERGIETWLCRGVANLRFFQANTMILHLGDGVSIRGRNYEDLKSLGFDDAVIDRIIDDWSGFGASSYVLVVESTMEKKPDKLIMLDSFSPTVKAMRAVQALRLLARGAVGIGRMWVQRIAHFNFGIGGLSSAGASIPTLGNVFVWTDEVAQAYPIAYEELTKIENGGYGNAPGNLEVALRSFAATFDRYPTFQDSKLLDAITALEALLGTGTELSFRLAFRVAGLLGASDKERARLLKEMREFYDTRSRIVHGGRLNEKNRLCLQKFEELQSIVRRLLRSFVSLAAQPAHRYTRAFFAEDLDATLLDDEERRKLQTALHIN